MKQPASVNVFICHWLVWVFVILHSAFVLTSAHAHPSDISYLQVKVERQRVELRFTFNVLTLTRFVPEINVNQDKQIDKAELDAAKPLVLSYLNEHIQVEVNGVAATLGEMQPFEYIWPAVEGRQSVAEVDYPVRYVDVTFMQPVKPLLADLWLSFEIWPQTGPLGSIEATFVQGDLRTQVPFTMSEPDYLYDTGYAVEEIFQEEKKADSRGWTYWPGVAVQMLFIVGLPYLGFVIFRRALKAFFDEEG